MYAVIEQSGSQTMVREGDVVTIDLLDDAKPGDTVTFDKVLVVGDAGGGAKVGTPYVGGASVSAEVVKPEVKGPKVKIYKFSERKGYKRKTGHRQPFTTVKVTAIKG